MPVLRGYGAAPYVQVSGGGPTNNPSPGMPTSGRALVAVDGTPIRVVILAFAAAAGLTALKMAGFKFNVGASV